MIHCTMNVIQYASLTGALIIPSFGMGQVGSATLYTTHLSSTVLTSVLCDPLLL
jgi:hypothetical protein